MRFMVMVRATKESESEGSPVADQKLFQDMANFNEELVKAGVMLAGEGLHPSSKGARVRFAPDGSRTVIDGPFAETKELIAGFWLWQVRSLEECLEWVKRCPAPFATECEIEVRRVYETEDFGEMMSPELIAQEERLREQVARLAK
ncbi:YciI family protein [Paludisphaera soli]|uniref:YciI family protein n=1 Tax=Paludisphaera soli TaxID=2712865 RepID=UPI0013EA1217|nr:YciI family protein [Paludisphaera soli]